MIDSLIIQIPFSPLVVRGRSDDCSPGINILRSCPWTLPGVFWVNPAVLPFPMGAREVVPDSEGHLHVSEVFCPWDSIASSHGGLAIKPFHEGNGKLAWPYLELKCSPAKLMQGHNVFGTDSVRLCVENMLAVLAEHYPDILPLIDIGLARVSSMDITYSVEIPFEKHRQALIDALRHVSQGQTKNRGDSYETTVYFGSKNSRLKRIKVYLKGPEIKRDIEVRKKKGLSLPSSEVVTIAQNLVRFELTVKKDWFERRLISTNLIDFMDYFDDLGNVRMVYDEGCRDLFKSLQGEQLRVTSDKDVLLQLDKVHGDTRGKAARLMGFYQALKAVGYDSLRLQYPRSSFSRYISDLEAAGFSRAHLSSLHETQGVTVIAFPQLVTATMLCEPAPEGYIPPCHHFLAA